MFLSRFFQYLKFRKSSKSSKIRKGWWWRRRIDLLIITIATLLVLHETILVSYGNWLAPPSSNFTSTSTFDAIAFFDVACYRVDQAAELVASGRAKSLHLFLAYDLDIEFCTQKYKEAIDKYNLSLNQVYWHGIIYTAFEGAKKFRDIMRANNLDYERVLIIVVRFGSRRLEWSFRKLLGNNIQISTLGNVDDKFMGNPQWWKDKRSRKWVEIESAKLAFYYFYYGLLGNDEPSPWFAEY